jgi:glycerophosphoryl diester phosphodiesterase
VRRIALACALLLAACDESAPSAATPQTQAGELAPSDLPRFFDCLRETDGVIVSAHRGGPAAGFAENALATLENTLSQAPVFLEIDVARTRDGALVLMHDDSVERTTDGEGALSALTLAELQAMRLRDNSGRVLNEHPPTLREALDWAEGRGVLELDVKRGVSYEDVVSIVRDADAMDRVVFITYSAGGAIRIARIAPDAMIYTTLEDESELRDLERAGVDLNRIVAWLGTGDVDGTLLNGLNAEGVEARIGAFRDRPDYEALAAAGVESIASDDPVRAFRALDDADGREGAAVLECAARS